MVNCRGWPLEKVTLHVLSSGRHVMFTQHSDILEMRFHWPKHENTNPAIRYNRRMLIQKDANELIFSWTFFYFSQNELRRKKVPTFIQFESPLVSRNKRVNMFPLCLYSCGSLARFGDLFFLPSSVSLTLICSCPFLLHVYFLSFAVFPAAGTFWKNSRGGKKWGN